MSISLDKKEGSECFQKNTILIPINFKGSLHWSLCAIINPSLVTVDHDGENDKFPCMAFFDSLVGSGLHNHHAVAADLFKWLNGLWNHTYSCVGNRFSSIMMPLFPLMYHGKSMVTTAVLMFTITLCIFSVSRTL
jgi:hypothetical protein